MKPPRSENDFDRLAFAYDGLGQVVFGEALERAQRAFIGQLPAGARVLFLGGGTGRVLPAVLARLPRSVCYVEKSAAMLRRAQRRTQDPRVTFVHGDHTHLLVQTPGSYDAVLTFFMLDVFDPPTLAQVMRTLLVALAPGGRWLLADFDVRQRGWWARGLLALMHALFRLTCRLQARQLADFRVAFEALGLAERQRKAFYGGLIQAVVYQRATDGSA